MFNYKLKEKIERIEKEVLILNKMVTEISNPFKFDVRDKVSADNDYGREIHDCIVIGRFRSPCGYPKYTIFHEGAEPHDPYVCECDEDELFKRTKKCK